MRKKQSFQSMVSKTGYRYGGGEKEPQPLPCTVYKY